MQLQKRRAVIDAIADHGSDDAEVVNACGHIREELTDRNAALPILLKGPRRFHEAADAIFAERQPALEGNRLPVIRIQARFRIERIDTRWTAVHEQEDDPFGLGRKMRNLWSERIDEGRGFSGDQAAKPEQSESRRRLPQERPAGKQTFFG